MGKAAEAEIMREIQSLRGEVTLLRDDVALMRSELGALAEGDAAGPTGAGEARETVRRLWTEGLASGIAGDLDEVVDEVLGRMPRTGATDS